MKILLLSVQFKTTKKRVLNWKKKFSQKLIFLNFNILKVQNITYVNGKCQKSWSKLSACLYIYMCSFFTKIQHTIKYILVRVSYHIRSYFLIF